jgi:hypothetical protein
MIKAISKRILRRLSHSFANELKLEFGTNLCASESVSQKILMQQYRALASSGGKYLPNFADIGFRKFSQFEEDGILLCIFSLIPPQTRRCVEICAGNGQECMATNLIVNHGWWGYLFDGSKTNVRDGQRFFANCKDTFLHPPVFRHAWITAENVNEQLETVGAAGPVDLLSLDIDGMDYWVWKAIAVIDPMVVVCETHNVAPPNKSITVPYDPQFFCQSEDYRGATLEAMCRLGREKGYRLVGTHRYGFNAFFIKSGFGEEYFPDVSSASCLKDPFSERRRKVWRAVEGLKWEEV